MADKYIKPPEESGLGANTKYSAIPEADVSFDTSGGHDHDGVNSKLIAGGATTFIGLTDTPADYSGDGGKYVKVNAGEDALEFDTPAGSGDMTKAVYDSDDDGLIDTTAGGTEWDSSAQTGFPYVNSGAWSAIAKGIANGNVLTVDQADAADNEFARFTASGMESLSKAELLAAINVADGADVTGSNAPQAHKDSHDPADGSDPLDTAAAAEIAGVQAAGAGTAHTLARSDHAHAINHGITDNHIVTIDHASVADDDYAKFTANGLEGRSYAEVKTDLSLGNVEDTALSTWAGSGNITTVGTLASGNADAVVSAASDSAQGKVELATAAETTTGTDATRVVTPDGLAGSDYGKRIMAIIVIDSGTAVTTGDGKAYFFIPSELNGYNLVDADAAVNTVSSSGTPTVQIHNVTDTADMLSTLITIDENEKTSYTAATPPVINGATDDVATGDELRIDVDVAGTGTKGLWVCLSFQKP